MPKRIFVWEYVNSRFEQMQAIIAVNGVQSTINGTTTSLMEAMTAANNILDKTALSHFVYPEEDDGQALTELQNTISTLRDSSETVPQS